MKQEASIKHWKIERRSGEYCIVGDIHEHPLLVEGETVIISPLITVNFKTMTAETENTIYRLL